MSKGLYHVPRAYNETILQYAPGSAERKAVKEAIATLKSVPTEIPMIIGGKEVKTTDSRPVRAPHEHQHILGYYYHGDDTHVMAAMTLPFLHAQSGNR